MSMMNATVAVFGCHKQEESLKQARGARTIRGESFAVGV